MEIIFSVLDDEIGQMWKFTINVSLCLSGALQKFWRSILFHLYLKENKDIWTMKDLQHLLLRQDRDCQLGQEEVHDISMCYKENQFSNHQL